MAHALHIRPAIASDAPEIGRINVQTWLHTYQGLIEQSVLDTLSIEKRQDFWRKVITELRPGRILLVCELHTDSDTTSPVIAGYISGGLSRLSGFEAEVYALYCDQHLQRCGAGSALLLSFFDFARAQQWKSVCVRVLSANPYKQFYYKHGAVYAHPIFERMAGKDYEEEVAVWNLVLE